MKIIKTYENIMRLKDSKALNPILVNYLDEYFKYLFRTFTEAESINNFTLEDVGYIVVLERGDNTGNLSEIGLSNGLLGCHPEYVNRVSLNDLETRKSIDIYQTLILFDNEYGLIFISEVGILNSDTEAFFAENTVD